MMDMMISNILAPRLLFGVFLFRFFLVDSGVFFLLFGVTVLRYLGLAQVESLHFFFFFGVERIRVKLLFFLIPAETINQHLLHFGYTDWKSS